MASSRPVLGPDRFELVPEGPIRRSTATLNLRWEDKEVFDAIKLWLAHEKGDPQSQWDVFSYLLAEALTNEGSPLSRAVLFRR